MLDAASDSHFKNSLLHLWLSITSSLEKNFVVNADLMLEDVLMFHQVLGIGVIIGSSVFGLFQAKVYPFSWMKRFICLLFILILAFRIILRPKPLDLRLCSMALTLGICNSYYRQKE